MAGVLNIHITVIFTELCAVLRAGVLNMSVLLLFLAYYVLSLYDLTIVHYFKTTHYINHEQHSVNMAVSSLNILTVVKLKQVKLSHNPIIYSVVYTA